MRQGVQTATGDVSTQDQFLPMDTSALPAPQSSPLGCTGLGHVMEPSLDFTNFATGVVGDPSAEQHFRGVYSTYTTPTVFKAKADI